MVQKHLKVIAQNTWDVDRQLAVFQMTCSEKCKTVMYNLQKLKPLRRYLTIEAATILVLGLMVSHLDYCNLMFAGLPKTDIIKLHKVQNITA